MKYFNPKTGLGIIRVSRDQFRTAWASLSFLNEFDKLPCFFRVLDVCGGFPFHTHTGVDLT